MATAPLPLPYSPPDQRASRLAAAAVALGLFIIVCIAREVFNDGDTGWHLATGRLILDSRAIPTVNGRADVYGDDFMRADSRINGGDIAALNREAEKWGITWTIFSPQTPIVARLDADPGWKRLHTDRWAVVHVRKPPG
jgi:hypothetical protein